ncbi:MAG TPA: metal ABC transporter substrate-binding protein, partial [Candidatus Avamphibacillus intestinigallinarum]|nr:metal ABC transporter substrate-binding protein [Candidatus Avamphibacillus intestinigallinarum]
LRIEKSDYQELTNSLIEMGLSDNPPAYETFVDSSFIDQAEVNE